MKKGKENKKIEKKIFIYILLVVLIIILFILIRTLRNYMIISDLQDKALQYKEKTNYYMCVSSNVNEKENIETKYYKKDDKESVIINKMINGEYTRTMLYNNGNRVDKFVESKEEKTAQLDSGITISVTVYNGLETENKWQTFIECLRAKINTEEVNGKNCYVISRFVSLTSQTFDGSKTYIEKDTGLCVKTVENEYIVNKVYEFDSVDENVFIEPDIGQFVLKENN